jgi:hypothetical protein
MGKCGAFDGTVSGNGDFQHFRREVFLKPDVTAFLADDNPAISL